MAINYKKILLAGTALVAVSAFSVQAQAAQAITNVVTTTVTTSAAATPTAPNTAGGATAGTVGFDNTTMGVLSTGTFTQDVDTTGGTGGIGGAGVGVGGTGGTGGAALDLLATADGLVGAYPTLVISATRTITGGTGGSGGTSTAANGAIGGNGGVAILMDANFGRLTDSGTLVIGGAGVAGLVGIGNTTLGGKGGTGGAGVSVVSDSNMLTLGSNVTGGGGAIGGNGVTTGNGGNGGDGGAGVTVAGASVDISVSAGKTVAGGDAGAGGSSVAGGGTGGTGGTGGAGINSAGATGATITVAATAQVNGGAAGAAGAGAGGGAAGAAGSAGDGITLAGTTLQVVNNAGTIVGGGAGAGVAIHDTATTTTSTISNTASTGIIGGTGAGSGIVLDSGKTLASITNTGGTIRTGTGKALDIVGTVASLVNTGTISATTGVALNIGAGAGAGILTAMTNTGGTITSANTTGAGSATGATVVLNSTAQTALTLNGTISNTASNNSAEALSFRVAPAAAITNAGTIRSDGTGAADSGLGVAVEFQVAGTLINSGTIYGQLIDTGNAARTVTNTGTIIGAINLDGTSITTLNFNSGTVTGAVTTGSNNDVFTHLAGTITGAVNLAAGNNQFTNTAGNIVGNITTTGGNDALSVAAGTLSGGTIDMGAGTNTLLVTGGTISDAITDSNTGGDDALTLRGGTITGAITLAGGTNSVTIGNGVATESFTTGNMIGATAAIATTVTAHSTFTVDNAYSSLAGAFGVNALGTLAVHGGNIVATGGTLTNAGTVTISDGHSIAAAVLATSTGTMNFEIGATRAGAPTAAAAAFSGAVDLAGSNLGITILPAAGYIADGTAFRVLSAGADVGGVTGVAGSVNGGASDTALYTFTQVDGNDTGLNTHIVTFASGTPNRDVWIIANRSAVTAAALGTEITSNDTSTNAALVTIGTGGIDAPADLSTSLDTIQGELAAAADAQAVHDILEAITPTPDGGASTAAFDVGAQTQGIADTRMAAVHSGDAASGMAAGSSVNGVTMWLQGYGQTANQDLRDGIPGFDANTLGAALGVDSMNLVDHGVIGVAINYARTNVDSDNVTNTKTDVDNYGLNLYGNYDLGQDMFLNGQLGYARNNVDQLRHDTDGVAGSGNNSKASFDSNQYSAKLALGRDFAQDYGMTLTPVVSAAYTLLDADGYTETGTGVLNTVNGNTMHALNLGLGGTASWKMKNADGSVMKPAIRAGYTYDATGDRVETTSSFVQGPVVGNPTFRTTGADPARHQFNAGLGMTYMTAADWDLSANYDYRYKADYSSHSGVLRASSHF